MARIGVETLDHVAKLAHLSLSREERETYARQIDEILAHAESIQTINTSGVPPMSHALTSGILREDTPGPSLPRDEVLASAPDASEGLFRVPRVIGG